MATDRIEEIDIDLIDEPQTELRMGYDPVALHELSQSIAANGLLQPIGVKAIEETGRYRRVWGGRRLAASILIGRTSIRAIVLDASAPELDAGVLENLDRADLSPVEEAQAINAAFGAGYSRDSLAARWHRSPGWIDARIELLGYPPDLLELLHRGRLKLAVAASLARIDNDSYRAYLTESALSGGATAAVVRAWVAEYEAQRPRIIHNQAVVEELMARPRDFTVLMACDGCAESTDLRKLRTYKLCPRCDQAIVATATAEKE
jgi:ParB/RepB/Spo0J family partition protein